MENMDPLGDIGAAIKMQDSRANQTMDIQLLKVTIPALIRNSHPLGSLTVAHVWTV